jgi:hypothetical protein
MTGKIVPCAAAVALACLCCALSACGGSAGASPEEARPESKTSAGIRVAARTPFRFFSSSSFWNRPVSASAPLDPSSPARMAAFETEIQLQQQEGVGPWINAVRSGIPVYTVSAHQHKVRVRLTNHAPERALSAAWRAVPLPPNAEPAAGVDGGLVVWQPSRDRLWEFFRLVHDADGWRASWGGAMRHVSSNTGVYGYDAWPGAKPWWGLSASSLSLVGGLISLEDLETGQINHALEMATPNRSRAFFSSPAQRTDGRSDSPVALPEGAHLRLNPQLDLTKLNLPPLTLLLAQAAQRYGIFITDGTGASGVTTFFAENPSPTGANPYAAPGGYFEGRKPSELLASFPWSQLQLLRMQPRSVELTRRARRGS